MRLRWLLGNFADPQHKLSAREQFEVSMVAHSRYMPTGRLVAWTLFAIVLPFLLLLKFGLPWILDWLGFAGRTIPFIVGAAGVVLLVWLSSSWVYGHLYTGPVRRAMRDRGVDLCVACGYVLNELPDDVRRCPECGAPRVRGEERSATETETDSG